MAWDYLSPWLEEDQEDSELEPFRHHGHLQVLDE